MIEAGVQLSAKVSLKHYESLNGSARKLFLPKLSMAPRETTVNFLGEGVAGKRERESSRET